MSDFAIKVQDLSKLYQLGQIGTGTLHRDIKRWWYKVRDKEDPFMKIGQENDRTKKSSSDLVWALKDINFECLYSNTVDTLNSLIEILDIVFEDQL